MQLKRRVKAPKEQKWLCRRIVFIFNLNVYLHGFVLYCNIHVSFIAEQEIIELTCQRHTQTKGKKT